MTRAQQVRRLAGAVTRRAGGARQRRRELGWEAQAAKVVPAASSYEGLTPRSLAFVTLRNGPARRFVNLVLPAYAPGATFAGIKTALEVGAQLAVEQDRVLRVIALRGTVSNEATRSLQEFVQTEFGLETGRVTLVDSAVLADASVDEHDTWLVTYWTTAHAVDVACRLGVIDRRRVIYLVQDYEPIFLPGSTASALAASTYHAGFTPLVNSAPLATYLERYEGVVLPPAQVFAPSLDLARLEQTHRRRETWGRPTVLFYGRPSKPRNMFPLGVAALRATARRLAGRVDFVSVGEGHRELPLAPGVSLRSVGALSWSGYFELLGTAEVLLSLQASPHPSHPPLDAVVSGGVAVTNELGGTRGGLHPRLHAASADPDQLAEAITEVVESGRSAPVYSPEFLDRLGRPLPAAVQSAARVATAATLDGAIR